MSQLTFQEVFGELVSGPGASAETVSRAFDAILAGDWTPVQVAGFAVALRLRGETPEQIAAAARALRRAMVPLRHDFPKVLDTCGTGGDGLATLNLSTAAALLAAAAGVPVAKHGNRAVSSRAGSADVFEALGVRIDLSGPAAEHVFAAERMVFVMAPTHHPAMRHGGVARRELGVRTIFNCLGPLANPASATHQLLGAYADDLRKTLARTLHGLGTQRAWVVHGTDGMDEISPYAPTRVTVLDGDTLEEMTVEPEDFGVPTSAPGAAVGGDAEQNASALETILAGKPHPARNAVLINAAAALCVANGLEPREGGKLASELLDSGAGLAKLAALRAATTTP
ncbi:MAG: anthranilate phosphoribosyltransferase [Polyangiaceae bacterium]